MRETNFLIKNRKLDLYFVTNLSFCMKLDDFLTAISVFFFIFVPNIALLKYITYSQYL